MLHAIYYHLTCLLSTLIFSFLQYVFPKASLANSGEIKDHSNYVFSLLTGEINHFLYHFLSVATFIYISLQNCRSSSVLLCLLSPLNHWAIKIRQNHDADYNPQLQVTTGIHTLRANNSDFCIQRTSAMSWVPPITFWELCFAKLVGDKVKISEIFNATSAYGSSAVPWSVFWFAFLSACDIKCRLTGTKKSGFNHSKQAENIPKHQPAGRGTAQIAGWSPQPRFPALHPPDTREITDLALTKKTENNGTSCQAASEEIPRYLLQPEILYFVFKYFQAF